MSKQLAHPWRETLSKMRESQRIYLEELKKRVREKGQPRPLINDSWERGVSLTDMLKLRRAGFNIREE